MTSMKTIVAFVAGALVAGTIIIAFGSRYELSTVAGIQSRRLDRWTGDTWIQVGLTDDARWELIDDAR